MLRGVKIWQRSEVGNSAKIKDLNDAIVLLNGQAGMHPRKRLETDASAEVEKVRERIRRRTIAGRDLIAPQRETIILMNDEDSTASVSTHQRTIITKLKATRQRN